MPFSLLLIPYLLFISITFDSFELMALLVCLIAGTVCGYFDYGRYFSSKGSQVLVSAIAIVFLFMMFIPNLDFRVSLVIVTCLSLSIGALMSIMVHSVTSLEKKEALSREINEGLEELNQALKKEKDSLGLTIANNKRREDELQVSIDNNLQTMNKLNYKNSQLVQKNTELENSLKTIAQQRMDGENELLSLKQNALVMHKRLSKLTKSQEDIDKVKKDLITREEALSEQIDKLTLLRKKETINKNIENIEKQLQGVRQELKSNEIENNDNISQLKQAHDSIALQEQEKINLESKISQMKQQQSFLMNSAEQLQIEKDNTKDDLEKIKLEIKAQRAANLENEKVIEDLSLVIEELKINDDFLNRWLDIEGLLKDYAPLSNLSTADALIDSCYKHKKIDRYLRDDLHKLRRRRNDRFHIRNTKIFQDDVIKADDCLTRLKRKRISA